MIYAFQQAINFRMNAPPLKYHFSVVAAAEQLIDRYKIGYRCIIESKECQ